MRELPEIEVLRRELEREIVGRQITTVDVQVAPTVTHTRTRKIFADLLADATIVSVARRGLLLLVGLDEGRVLVVRLGETGTFRRGPVTEPAGLTVAFAQGPSLHVFGLGKDAEIFVVVADQLDAAVPELAKLGFDPLDEPLTWVRFSSRLSGRHEPMKRLLLDATFVAGLGEVYIDEVLFEAGVRYDRMCDSLSSQEVRRLYRSLIEVMHDAVKHRGSSLGVNGFGDLAGKPGEHQDHLQVYGREGKLSPRSRTPIKKIKYEGRWTYYCDTQV